MLASLVRTVVPLLVGWLLGVPVVARLGITEAQLVTAVTALVTGAYYLAVRVFEVYVSPRFGWLLGLARTPTYANAKTIPVEPVDPAGP